MAKHTTKVLEFIQWCDWFAVSGPGEEELFLPPLESVNMANHSI